MNAGTNEFQTERLLLRQWRRADHEPFVRMNQDPKVMEYFPALLTRQETELGIARIEAHIALRGFGLWAAELRDSGEFIGFIGLSVPAFQAAFTPCVEIGWRLAAAYWGNGLATEGARAAADYGFATLQLPELVSFTTEGNARSRRVMEKIGMTRDPGEDFDHPSLSEGHPLRRHVLYRLKNPVSHT